MSPMPPTGERGGQRMWSRCALWAPVGTFTTDFVTDAGQGPRTETGPPARSAPAVHVPAGATDPWDAGGRTCTHAAPSAGPRNDGGRLWTPSWPVCVRAPVCTRVRV